MTNQPTATLFPTATGNELFSRLFPYLTEIGSLTAPEYCIQNELTYCDTWEEILELFELEKPATQSAKIALERAIKRAKTESCRPTQAPQQSLEAIIAAAIAPHVKPQNVELDENKVVSLIKQHSKPYVSETKVTINNDKNVVVKGRQHKEFSKILRYIETRTHLYLYGPAGTGKTQAAENAATAIGLDFFPLSVCGQTTKSELLGYTTANGSYIGTHFRTAYENGGVFLMDEIDNGNPNVLSVLNSALANGVCAFPDKVVPKNPNFVFLASANTFGTGASAEYIGRNPLDAATLDRFKQIFIDYDEELETELFPTAAPIVQNLRKGMKGERVVLSMRKTALLEKCLNVFNLSKSEAMQEAILDQISPNLQDKAKQILNTL